MTKKASVSPELDEPPARSLLVMAIENGALHREGVDECGIYAAIELTSSMTTAMKSLSALSLENGMNLAIHGWFMTWDHEDALGITKSVWKVSGLRQWAECHTDDEVLLGQTVALDVRELDMPDFSAPLVWHDTEASSLALAAIWPTGPFEFAAWPRLAAQGFVSVDDQWTPSTSEQRRLELELLNAGTSARRRS